MNRAHADELNKLVATSRSEGRAGVRHRKLRESTVEARKPCGRGMEEARTPPQLHQLPGCGHREHSPDRDGGRKHACCYHAELLEVRDEEAGAATVCCSTGQA